MNGSLFSHVVAISSLSSILLACAPSASPEGSGGAPATGGAAASGGAPGSGGSMGSGGFVAGSGGNSGVAGAAPSGGATGTGGRSPGTGGAPTTGTGGAPTAGTGGAGGNLPHFSFFVASQAGLQRLSGSQNGFGGDLRFGKADGLAGADELCRQLAETSMPGASAKTWRAFLSVKKGPSGAAVNAIERIGEGPWYDRMGRVLAMTKADVQQTRPRGADAAIANDLPNENGIPNHNPDGAGDVNNHHTLTGSNAMGMVGTGANDTCQDWTSTSAGGAATAMQGPAVGLAYPRGFGAGGTGSGMSWIFDLHEAGCAPGVTPGGGAQLGPSGTVGGSGGYGGIYCFALTP